MQRLASTDLLLYLARKLFSDGKSLWFYSRKEEKPVGGFEMHLHLLPTQEVISKQLL